MYKLDLSESLAWINFVMVHNSVSILNQASEDAGVLSIDYAFGETFVVNFKSRERAMEFLLKWG